MTGPLRVRHGRLHAFFREVLKRVRVAPEHATQVADALVGAHLRGRDRDGAAWLPELVEAISTRHVNAAPELEIVSSSGGASVLDAGGGPGPVGAHRAMNEAIQAANRHACGAVAVRRGNRFGAPGHYAAYALRHQMAGVAIGNGPPVSGPETGAPAARGPVELGIALPTAETAPPLLLDLTLGADGDGEAGGREAALALVLEGLATIGGAAFAAELAESHRPEPAHRGVGHLFLAFRIRAFTPWGVFRNRMVEQLAHLRRARIEPPGREAAAVEEERRTLGVPLPPETAESLRRLAYSLGLRDEWDGIAAGPRGSRGARGD